MKSEIAAENVDVYGKGHQSISADQPNFSTKK